MSLAMARFERSYDSWRGAVNARCYGSRVRRISRRRVFHDHNGNAYSSLKEMCKHYGISVALYFKRTAMGYSLMRVLTTDVKLGAFSHLIAGRNAVQVSDHTGRVFKSKKEMCDYWGVSTSTYNTRIKKGKSVFEALTTPVRKSKPKCSIDSKPTRSAISAVLSKRATKKKSFIPSVVASSFSQVAEATAVV